MPKIPASKFFPLFAHGDGTRRSYPESLPGLTINSAVRDAIERISAAAAEGTASTHDVTGLPLAANGFHDLQAIVDANAAYSSARFIYVDPVAGNDSTATIYSRGAFPNMFAPGSVNAFSTVPAANAQRRANQCDVILFRRGRTFSALPSLNISGISQSARAIVAAYGTTGARPFFPGLTTFAAAVSYVIYADLDLTQTGTADTTGINLTPNSTGDIQHVLFENLFFSRHFKGFVGENREATTTLLHDIVFYRNIFYRCVGQTTSFNSTAMYNRRMDLATLDQNIYIENGWDGVNAATKDIQSRHVYVDDCRLMLVRENIMIRPSSEQIQFRANLQGPGAERRDQGTMRNNLMLDGGLHVLLAENDGDVQMRFEENVVQGTLTTDPIGYAGRALQFEGATNAVVDRNIFVQSDAEGAGWPLFGQALSFWQGANANIQITNNFFSRSGFIDLIGAGTSTPTNITISGNRVSVAVGNLIEHNITGANFTGNQFFGGDASPFRFSGSDYTLAAWQAASGASGNSYNAIALSAPPTIESYLTAQGLGSTLADYMALLLGQDRINWNSALEAATVNTWFRAQIGGF